MNNGLWWAAALCLVVSVSACGDSSDDPQTIRETGYLSCQSSGDCDGGFNCETDDNELECVSAPQDCAELTCECLGDELCGDRGCHVDSGVLLCSPEPFDPCGDKVCGESCSTCDPADPECSETAEEKACNDAGECVANSPGICGEPQQCEVLEDQEPLTCEAHESCCGNVCCGIGEICCTGVPFEPGEGSCIPEDSVGGCPQSLRSVKDDIEYLSSEQVEALGQQAKEIRLTTWRYKSEPESMGSQHLGFIIEDVPGPYTVQADGRHVNLYGYTSLAVAAVQTQAKEIELLKEQVELLKAQVEALKAAK